MTEPAYYLASWYERDAIEDGEFSPDRETTERFWSLDIAQRHALRQAEIHGVQGWASVTPVTQDRRFVTTYGAALVNEHVDGAWSGWETRDDVAA